MKECFKCKQVKPLTDFYKHPEMSDGYVNKCKECNKNNIKSNYLHKREDPLYIEKERTRGREKYRRLYTGTGKSNIKSNIKYFDKYPEKKKATTMSANLKKPFDSAERHHWSYNEIDYKDVIWLTKKEHMKAHRFIIYDQERMMYRRYDNNELLETRDRHTQFIMMCIKTKED